MTFRDDAGALHERIHALEAELEDERSARRSAEEKLQALVADADKLRSERAAVLAAEEARGRRATRLQLAVLGLVAVVGAAYAMARYDDAARAHRHAAASALGAGVFQAEHERAVIAWGWNVAMAAAAVATALLIILRRRTFETIFCAAAGAMPLATIFLGANLAGWSEIGVKVLLACGATVAIAVTRPKPPVV